MHKFVKLSLEEANLGFFSRLLGFDKSLFCIFHDLERFGLLFIQQLQAEGAVVDFSKV